MARLMGMPNALRAPTAHGAGRPVAVFDRASGVAALPAVVGLVATKRRRVSGPGAGAASGSGSWSGHRGVFGPVSPVACEVNGATWSPRLIRRALARRLTPSLGGDGGLLGLDIARDVGNGRVCLTCAAPGTELVETIDAADRAHRTRVWDVRRGWVYLAAADERGRPIVGLAASPRRYPRSSMTSRGVAFDSAFDETHERQRRLAGVARLGGGSCVADLKYRPQRGGYLRVIDGPGGQLGVW